MFNYKTIRARKARLANVLERKWLQAILIVLVGLFGALWVYIVWGLGDPAGHWLIVGWAWSLVPLLWFKGDTGINIPQLSL